MKYLFKSIALLTLLVIAGSTFAQKKVYFDKNWKKTKESSAKYYRIVTPQEGEFYVEDYFKESESLQMTGTYKTKKLLPEDRTGKFVYYYKNGKKMSEGEFEGKNRVGDWKFWYNDGSIKREGKYDVGEMVGDWIGYHIEGNVKSKMTYVDGNKHGKSIFYHKNDSLEEEFNFVKGKKHGDFVVYHENGKLNNKGSYEKDSLTGEYYSYWENGNLSYKANYSNNKRDGECIWYHDNGTNSCVAEFKKGKFLRAEFFEEDGEKVNKKIQEKDLVEPLEYPGGNLAMRDEVGKQVLKKINMKEELKNKTTFTAVIELKTDIDGNVKSRKWVTPAIDSDDADEYDDDKGFVRNINNAIDGFATFKPRVAFNRKIETSITVIYNIDFTKKTATHYLIYF